jgi:CRP-like cAMP-binding protein
MAFRNDLFVQALRRFELLAGVSDETLGALSAEVGARRVSRGVCLWRTGMKAEQVVFVQSGFVSMRGASGGSGRAVYAFVGPYEVSSAEFALRWGVYGASAYVSSDRVDLLVLETSSLARAAQTDPALRRALEGAAARGPVSFEPKLQVLYAGAAPRRLAALTVHLAERYGRTLTGGAVRVPTMPSLPDLAAYAGLNASVATEHFGTWAAQGIARLESGGLLVESMPALESLAYDSTPGVACEPARSSGVIRRSALKGESLQARALRRR